MAAFIIYIIRWAVVLTMLYSLFGLFLKRETLHGFNRVVLLAILVASIVLPLCQIETGRKNFVTQSREIIESQIANVQNPLSNEVKKVTITNPDNGVRYTHIPIREDVNAYILIAIAFYLTGLLISWLRYFWQLSALLLLIHRSKRVALEGLPKGVRVLVHRDIKTPCSWMCWMLLNPADVNVRPIIKHELSHIRLGHSWDILLCEFTCRMLWFVPFTWMLRQDLRDVHEYQADRRVLQDGIKDEEYQLLLIRKATGKGLQPVVNALNQSPIKRRFKMMYTKPSQRWVALKAAYLLPLSLMALMAFARPQAMSEIEQKVEKTETEIAQVIEESGVIDKVVTLAEDLGLKERETELTTQSAEQEALTDSVTISDHPNLVMEYGKNSPDANLVKADLANSQPAEEAFVALSVKRVSELIDSTMQAVGARKIADGTWIGHFQPSLNNDTVRVGHVEYLDKQSRQTGKLSFPSNESDPYSYDMILQQETRKERTGYYIRKLYPAIANVRQYDQVKNDPYLLPTDEVLTKNSDLPSTGPIAIEQTKKETRWYMYVRFRVENEAEMVEQLKTAAWKNWAIYDVKTGDNYMFRSTDNSYFKYVKQEEFDDVKLAVYQMCLIFPPLGKHVDEIQFKHINSEGIPFKTYRLRDIPRKARVITK